MSEGWAKSGHSSRRNKSRTPTQHHFKVACSRSLISRDPVFPSLPHTLPAQPSLCTSTATPPHRLLHHSLPPTHNPNTKSPETKKHRHTARPLPSAHPLPAPRKLSTGRVTGSADRDVGWPIHDPSIICARLELQASVMGRQG